MFCFTTLMIIICDAIFITESSSSVYKNILKKFDVQPLTDYKEDAVSQENEHYYNQGLNCAYPRDCTEVQQCGRTKSGVYRVYPYGLGPGFLVSCDTTTREGGWLIFQRRQDGSVDFYRNRQNYTDGFGNLYGEFWLGLEKIHLLTSQGNYKLLVLLRSYDNRVGYAEYDKFFVSDATENFRLMVGVYSGNIGNSLGYHNGAEFTTRDSDHDHHSTVNCAKGNLGGWWYKNCHSNNLNGMYFNVHRKDEDNPRSVSWKTWTKGYKPLQFTEMMLQPVGSN